VTITATIKNKYPSRELWAISGNDLIRLQVAVRMYVNQLEDGSAKQDLLDTIERTRFANLTELTAPRE
jgi:hypothetical protein